MDEMKTDQLVYLLFQEIPQGVFRLVGRRREDAAKYEFKSVELKETAFRCDAVFAPLNPADSDEPTYLVEAQFQRDKDFYARQSLAR